MKDQGIIVYTILFQVNAADIQAVFEDCATSSQHYFNAPTNEELRTVFLTIANDLSNLRIAE